MIGLDETDREILRLLVEDSRRPYSNIAEQVDLSAPAVSDRVDRLREMGVIRGFTLDIDRSVLRAGVPVLLTVEAKPGRAAAIEDALVDADPVEHVLRTADGSVTVTVTTPQSEVPDVLSTYVDLDDVDSYDVRLIADREWSPGLSDAEFAPACAECGNTVDEEGERRVLDDEPYYFCCSSCADRFVDQYETLKKGA